MAEKASPPLIQTMSQIGVRAPETKLLPRDASTQPGLGVSREAIKQCEGVVYKVARPTSHATNRMSFEPPERVPYETVKQSRGYPLLNG
jgi:hypothetical protein